MGKKVNDGKSCALLSYFLIGILWYFLDDKMRKNSFANFHTKQSLVLLGTCLLIEVIQSVLMFITLLGPIILTVLHVGLVVLWIMGIINAANGDEKELPVIGSFAKNLKF